MVATVGSAVAPELAPVLAAGEKFASEQFKATNAGKKRRDPFGSDEGGTFARQEGGIVISMPEQGGGVISGHDDAKNRWIKGNDTLLTKSNLPRKDEFRPYQADKSFFLVKGDRQHNTRQALLDGQIYITSWDWKHDDNAGYYKVFIHLKRASQLNNRDHRN